MFSASRATGLYHLEQQRVFESSGVAPARKNGSSAASLVHQRSSSRKLFSRPLPHALHGSPGQDRVSCAYSFAASTGAIADFCAADFFAGAFLADTRLDFAAFSALIAAQRFLVAAMIFRLPAALSFRLGFTAAGLTWGAGVSACFLDSAHLLRCAAAILFRAAADIFRLGFSGSEPAPGSERLPSKIP